MGELGSGRRDDDAVPLPLGLCWRCIHKHPAPTCDAYPNGIPDVFIMGELEHRRPYSGDNGIQFEENPSIAAKLAGQQEG